LKKISHCSTKILPNHIPRFLKEERGEPIWPRDLSSPMLRRAILMSSFEIMASKEACEEASSLGPLKTTDSSNGRVAREVPRSC